MSNISGMFRVVVLAASLSAVTNVRAADNGGVNNTGVVDCGDPATALACAECCSVSCFRISCCPLVGPCTIKNPGPPGGPLNTAFNLKLVVAGLNLQFQRSIKADFVDVKLKASFVKKTFPHGVNAKVRLTGSDAAIAGLVWPVAFLGLGDGAGTALANASISVTIAGTPITCQSLFPSQVCTDMAVGLAHHIQGGLGVGEKDDLTRFLDAVNGMGLGPCGIF